MTTTRAPSDGGLRALYRKHLPGFQLTAIESATTSPGVPDTEYCSPYGTQGWIENKRSDAWAVTIRPLQVAWISRRARLGGRVFIAVRRLTKGGPKTQAADELWLIHGRAVEALCDGGLRAVRSDFVLCVQSGGPEAWDWGAIKDHLIGLRG
jgi:hypothetical protein